MNKCKICDVELSSFFNLSMHIIKYHKLKSKEYYDMYLKKINDGICVKCGKVTKFLNISKGYRNYCSRKCTSNSDAKKEAIKEFYNNEDNIKEKNQKLKQTCLEKYGVDNPMKNTIFKDKLFQSIQKKYGHKYPLNNDVLKQKAKQTCLKKYGTEYAMNNKEFQHKIRKTFQKKYNSNSPFGSKEIRKNISKILLDKYGYDNPSNISEFKEKRRLTFIKKYGVDNPSKLQKIKDRIKNIHLTNFYNNTLQKFKYKPLFTLNEYLGSLLSYKWECNKCGHIFESKFQNGYTLHCPKCEPLPKSIFQHEILLFLLKYVNDIKQNSREILDSKKELDFYIKSKNVGIEFNGNYWHSELNGKDKNYHLNKTNECDQKNIRLIHIFEDEWRLKENIVKNRLKNILDLTKYHIFARNCIVKEIDTQLKNKFLDKYHIQGDDKSKIKLGLFYKNRLVSIMTFCQLRIALGQNHIENQWELSRFATINNFNVIGGASKLLTYFIKNYNPKEIISYADRRWSNGNLYYKLGFKLDHISSPNYWYLNQHNFLKRSHRFNFRKDRLPLLLEKFDPQKTEWENMQNNGYDRIWDCGNLVFKWIKPNIN